MTSINTLINKIHSKCMIDLQPTILSLPFLSFMDSKAKTIDKMEYETPSNEGINHPNNFIIDNRNHSYNFDHQHENHGYSSYSSYTMRESTHTIQPTTESNTNAMNTIDINMQSDNKYNTNITNEQNNSQPPSNIKNEDTANFDFLDNNEIQRDAADETVATIVLISISFLAIIFLLTIVACLLLVTRYGVIAFVAISTLLFVIITCSIFIWKTIERDNKLRKVRKKMKRWHEIVVTVVQQEIRNFQLDMNDHWLLENGSFDCDDDMEKDNHTKHDNTNSSFYGKTPKQSNLSHGDMKANQKKRNGGSRSVMFGLFVKPFLRKDGTRRFGSKRKNKRGGQDESIPELS